VSERRFWLLPSIVTLGALTKESFIPFSFVFLMAWWIVVRRSLNSPIRSFVWISTSWLTGLMALIAVQWFIRGGFVSPLEFGAALHQNHEYVRHFTSSLLDRNFWYTYCWLLPIGILRLKRFPTSWLVPTAATAVTAFILDAYYGGSAGTVGRALFSVTGPILTLSAAAFLLEDKSPRSPS
jgi:hypothetical protein